MNEGLSNVYIDEIMTKFSKIYSGCYSADNFPKNLKPPFCVIINLSKHNKPGTHFITLLETMNKTFYFDSFGIVCFVNNICEFIEKKQKPIYQKIKQIQHHNSLFCGFFCMFFCLYMERQNYNLDTFYKVFSSNLKNNDYICIKEIKKIMCTT